MNLKNIFNLLNKKISIYTEAINTKILNLKSRMNYTNEEYDITIIEIKEKDGIKSFLELDEDIISDIIKNKNKNDKYKDESIYIIQYPEGKLSVSYGIINNIFIDKKYSFPHICSTKGGSSGSPILKNSNNKVIGIHKEGNENDKNGFNKGTFLNYPIKEFIGKYIIYDNKEEEEITEYSDYFDVKINKFNLINNLQAHKFYFNEPINLGNQNVLDSNSKKQKEISNKQSLDKNPKLLNKHNRYISCFNKICTNNIFDYKNKDKNNEIYIKPYIKKQTNRMSYKNINNLTPKTDRIMTAFTENKSFGKNIDPNQKNNNLKKNLFFW